jgi:hypothetical protein
VDDVLDDEDPDVPADEDDDEVPDVPDVPDVLGVEAGVDVAPSFFAPELSAGVEAVLAVARESVL